MDGKNIVEERTHDDRAVLLTIEDNTPRLKSAERYSWSCLWAEIK